MTIHDYQSLILCVHPFIKRIGDLSLERRLIEISEAVRSLESDPVMARAWRRRAKQKVRNALDDLVRVRVALQAMDQAMQKEFIQSFSATASYAVPTTNIDAPFELETGRDGLAAKAL